ncbi:hypothetical protein JW805_07030 [Roseomonas aeriglobus]|nr:hypothetical protein [Roseomonas aeriglobus]
MDFEEYQRRAAETVKVDPATDEGRMELVFGLMSEVGSLARAFKLYLRDRIGLDAQRSRLIEDLGDVQWYLVMIAGSLGISMEEVVDDNLARTHDRYSHESTAYRPPFDDGYPDREVFPRRMLFRIVPAEGAAGDLSAHVSFHVEDARPYAFPELEEEGAEVGNRGFVRGQRIGDPVNDNAMHEDGYRFHDAVHVAFMAVLGWSPVMRQLLQVKRKSDPDVDRTQDGARARDLEEALSAILKVFSRTRNDFASETDIDGEVRDLIRRVVTGLEVEKVPIWLWATAIAQGYEAMNALRMNGGGWLLADLDRQEVAFHAERPEF